MTQSVAKGITTDLATCGDSWALDLPERKGHVVAKSVKSSSDQAMFGKIHTGDARHVLRHLGDACVDLSFWSPPYFVGKSYEDGISFKCWKSMLNAVIVEHSRILRPGGFMAINIGDILCFVDPDMPRFQANNINGKRVKVTREQIIKTKKRYPNADRYRLASLLGCSEQTIQRRMENNNVRGGKHDPATKILLMGGMLQEWAESCGLYLYDRRVWHKDPCWATNRWHSTSYRAVDEFEHIYIFWRPGIIEYERDRLAENEWAEWGSRGVWHIRSIRRNDRHEAEFPEMLAERVIKLFSPKGGRVIDPFVGSGTTTVVAKRLGRQWLGIDMMPPFAKIAERRTNNA